MSSGACARRFRYPPDTIHVKGGVMKHFVVGLFSAAAIATTILLVRQQKEEDMKLPRLVPAGETQAPISLERIRELGL